MTWSPLEAIPRQWVNAAGSPLSGYWLIAFQSGTSTRASMAISTTGSGSAAKFETNSLGYLISSGGAIIRPYVDRNVKLALVPTEAAADASDISNAVFVIDDLGGIGLGTFDTLADAKAATYIGATSLETLGYYAKGDGGHGKYYFVPGSVATANDFNIVTVTGGRLFLLPTNGTYNIKQAGAYADGTNAAATTAAIQAVIDAVGASYKIIIPPATAYYAINDTIDIKNKFGFHLEGEGNIDKCVLGCAGIASQRMIYQNDCRLTVLKGFKLAAGVVNNFVACDAGLTISNTNEFPATSTQNRIEDIQINGFADDGLTIESNIGSQNDIFEAHRCFLSGNGRNLYVQGASTFALHFIGGSIDDFTDGVASVELHSGNNIIFDGTNFITGGNVGGAPIGYLIRRQPAFGRVSINNSQGEGNALFFHGPTDASSANDNPVCVTNCDIGYTGAAGNDIINYVQQAPFTIRGSKIGNSVVGTHTLRFNSPGPGTAIILDGNTYDAGTDLVFSGGSKRCGFDAVGLLYAGGGIKFPTSTMTDYVHGDPLALALVGKGSAGTHTVNSSSIRYTRIGRLLFVGVFIDWSSHTGTGQLALQGLPVGQGSGSSALVRSTGFAYTAGAHLLARISGTEILFETSTGGTNTALAVPAAGTIEFGICYEL